MTSFYSPQYYGASQGSAKYRLRLDVSSAGRNVESNNEDFIWALVIEKDRSYQGFYGWFADAAVVINGVTVWSMDNVQNPNAAWTGWSSHTVASGRITINHDADGTLDFNVSASWVRSFVGASYAPNAMYVNSQTFVATTIPRATEPTVTPSPATVGSTVTIDLPRAVNTFTHDVTWVSGEDGGTIGTGLGASATWTVPDVMSEFPGKRLAPITIIVETYSGATLIGTKQVTLLARNTPAVPSSEPPEPDKQFDIRAREVTFSGGEWRARNPVPASELTLVDPSSATTTCTVSMSRLNAIDFEDYSIVDIDVFDGENWVFTDHRLVLLRVEEDKVDPSQMAKFSGTEFIDFELGRLFTQKDYNWDGGTDHLAPTSPGEMLRAIIADAKARGWGPRVEIEFTADKTSLGDPWANKSIKRTVSRGTAASQVIAGLVEDGYLEYRTEYRDDKAYLVLLNPGTGSDYSANGSSPVVNFGLANLSRAPRRGSVEDRITRVTVVGDTVRNTGDPNTASDNTESTTIVTRARTPFDPDVFGHLEAWVSASGVTTDADANAIGDNALRDNFSPTSERTFEYEAQNATPQFYPYSVFTPGDWVKIPVGDNGQKDRLAQITIAKTIDSFSITALTGDRILSGTASIAKRQAASVGGSIPGGTQTTPASLDSRIPSGPVIDTITSEGYWTSDGLPKSRVTINWAAVTEAMNGASLSIDSYEVWWRPLNSDEGFKYQTTVPNLEAVMGGWDVLDDLEFRVRAHSAAGVFGEFSENQEITTLAPATDLDGPDLADLYTDGVGNIFAVWGGTLDGAPAPLRVAYVVAEVSSDGGTVYEQMGTPITAAGAIVISPMLSGIPVYGTFEVRLRPYDKLGNPGTASDPQTIITTAPDPITQTPIAPTGLTATAGAGWDAAGVNPMAWFDLDWDAVTEDTEGNAVAVVGYDLWGKRAGEVDLRFLTSVTDTTARWTVAPDEEWSFQVSASSDSGGQSSLSDPATATADATITAPAAPAAPTLEQYAGLLRVRYSGVGYQPYIKYAYAMISTSSGGTYVRAGAPLTGAGEVVVPGLATGVTYYAKIVLVAEDGQIATSPASSGLLLDPITGVTVQTDAAPNTGIKLTNAGIFAYNVSGNPTFTVDAATGEVTIAAYDGVFELGADGFTAEGTPTAVTGLAISSEDSTFNTFFHPSGLQIRNDQTPLSWWEADPSDASLVNFVSPRAHIKDRLRIGDFEFLREDKGAGASRLVVRYKGA